MLVDSAVLPHATGVGVFGIVMKMLSSIRSTTSSGAYGPLSPWRTYSSGLPGIAWCSAASLKISLARSSLESALISMPFTLNRNGSSGLRLFRFRHCDDFLSVPSFQACSALLASLTRSAWSRLHCTEKHPDRHAQSIAVAYTSYHILPCIDSTTGSALP